MDTSSYLREKLINARDALACGRGDIKQRLAAAYTSFAAICTADVDEQYRWAFGQIREALVAKGSIQTTLEAMDEAEAKKIAVSILELLDTLQRDRPPICG